MEAVGIGLVGYGTVGSGVGRLLSEGVDEIRLATGKDVVLRTVCELSPERRALVPPGVALTTDYADLVNDPAIDVVIELIGGIEPARTIQLAALKAGKAVVTANKQLLSQYGAELLQAAEDHGAFLRFEASSVEPETNQRAASGAPLSCGERAVSSVTGRRSGPRTILIYCLVLPGI